jgi:type IV pilus assembly protein PilV
MAGARRQRGTTLIEAMVAMLLLMVGLLGVLGMKVVGLKYAGQANGRAAAALSAAEIIDRLRANPVLAAAGSYNIALTATPVAVGIATTDITQWRQNIAANLPSGKGSVTVATVGTVVTATVVLQWTERSAENGADRTLSFTSTARL